MVGWLELRSTDPRNHHREGESWECQEEQAGKAGSWSELKVTRGNDGRLALVGLDAASSTHILQRQSLFPNLPPILPI